jgi:DNA-binding MarR family transcriptional regulator
MVVDLVYEQLAELLHDINRGMGKYARDIFAANDLPFSLFMISKHIKAEPGITVSEMARRTGIAKSHISNQIRKLEERGWVEKRLDVNDQRIIRLYLSKEGSSEMVVMRNKIRQQFSSLLSEIPPQRAEELASDLAEIKTIIDKHREEIAPEKIPSE